MQYTITILQLDYNNAVISTKQKVYNSYSLCSRAIDNIKNKIDIKYHNNKYYIIVK